MSQIWRHLEVRNTEWHSTAHPQHQESFSANNKLLFACDCENDWQRLISEDGVKVDVSSQSCHTCERVMSHFQTFLVRRKWTWPLRRWVSHVTHVNESCLLWCNLMQLDYQPMTVCAFHSETCWSWSLGGPTHLWAWSTSKLQWSVRWASWHIGGCVMATISLTKISSLCGKDSNVCRVLWIKRSLLIVATPPHWGCRVIKNMWFPRKSISWNVKLHSAQTHVRHIFFMCAS